MSEFANVNLQSLQMLNQGLTSSRSRFHQTHEEIIREIEKYFHIFRQKKEILQDRLNKAENALASAENELYEMERRKHWVEDEDGSGGHWTPDTSAQEAKVCACKRHRDSCRDKLTECRSIIERCEHNRKFISGTYSIIDRNFCIALNDLQVDINNVLDYQGQWHYPSAEHFPYQPTTEKKKAEEKPRVKEKVIRQRFFDKEGNPIVNAKVVIADNQPFGFQDQHLTTDENGFATMPFAVTEDCSIYLEGKEIYNGKLFENMEYNRYADGQMSTSLTENNSSETESRMFYQTGRHIDVTHSINIDTDYPYNMRRQESFTRNDKNDELENIEISITSDEHKSNVKDGWIKVIKDDNKK